MRLLFYILVFSVCANEIFAHETNEAFFSFIIKDNSIEVEAEFPWTIRNALLQFNPSLQKSADQKDFEQTFMAYITANLILKDEHGNNIQLLDIKEIESNGHSHQNNYLIKFKGTNAVEATNTIMFELYDDQVNYNTVIIESVNSVFETNVLKQKFYFKENKELNGYSYLLLLAPILYLGYVLYNETSFRKK
ncbi:hypothetical protein [Maribacter sp. Asnod1-A12]|uniref:hypothetical protein n=1 Tax=Maribacter sp. Asnod1-A12 TaxID=3160576 RepID=UPI00387001B4